MGLILAALAAIGLLIVRPASELIRRQVEELRRARDELEDRVRQMDIRDFRRAGHMPTLFCAFLYFDVSFMVWILPGALANSIVPEFGLSDSQKGLMVAVPLLGGALLRLLLGLLTDHIGARRTGILGMALTMLPLLLGWLWADRFDKLLLVGLLLGCGRGQLRGRAAAGQPMVPSPGIRGSRWGSRGPGTAAPPWLPSSGPGWRRFGVGMLSSAWPSYRCWQH